MGFIIVSKAELVVGDMTMLPFLAKNKYSFLLFCKLSCQISPAAEIKQTQIIDNNRCLKKNYTNTNLQHSLTA